MQSKTGHDAYPLVRPESRRLRWTIKGSWRSSELWPAETAESQRVAKYMVSSFVSRGWRTRLASRVLSELIERLLCEWYILVSAQ